MRCFFTSCCWPTVCSLPLHLQSGPACLVNLSLKSVLVTATVNHLCRSMSKSRQIKSVNRVTREKQNTQGKNCPSPVVCISFMSVTYSTHTDNKTGVKCQHEVHTTVYRSAWDSECCNETPPVSSTRHLSLLYLFNVLFYCDQILYIGTDGGSQPTCRWCWTNWTVVSGWSWCNWSVMELLHLLNICLSPASSFNFLHQDRVYGQVEELNGSQPPVNIYY